LLPCICVLQPELIHLYQTSSLAPIHLRILTSVLLRLLYLLLYITFFKFIYSHVYTLLGSFLPPALLRIPLPLTLFTSRQNLFCPFLQFCWREEICNNKKDKDFLLVEKRLAIQRDS
jgi:hypothetical protein